MAVIVQVKGRDGEAAADDDEAKAVRWCLKHGTRAARQGAGTRRSLASGAVEVTSLRGHSRTIGPVENDWPIVVIVDHPLDPPADLEGPSGTVFLSIHDWHALHALIRSTVGAISFVHRAAESGIHVPIGAEVDRYRLLADADMRWAGLTPTAVPALPGRLLSTEEAFAADLYSELMEIAADSTSIGWDPVDYLRLIERLDSTPTLARLHLGEKMQEAFLDMVEHQSRRSFTVADRERGAALVMLYEYDDGDEPDLQDKYFSAHLSAYALLPFTT